MDGWTDINCAELGKEPQILALESSLEILGENSYFHNKTRKQTPSKRTGCTAAAYAHKYMYFGKSPDYQAPGPRNKQTATETFLGRDGPLPGGLWASLADPSILKARCVSKACNTPI